MTVAHRFYIPDSLLQTPLMLAGAEARHLARVLRMQPGEVVTLFDGRGNEVRARIDAIDRRSVTLSPSGHPIRRPTAGCRVILATAVPKGDRARWLVEKATELGAVGWIPLVAERSAVHPRHGRLEKLQQTVIAACKQCGRNDLMPIHPLQTWAEFLKDAGRDGPLLIADPGGPSPDDWLNAGSPQAQALLTVVIGPEGGLTDEELRSARARGAQFIGLGESLLRIETAALAALAALRMR